MYVDYLGRNLYWTDTFYDRIEVARLDDPENRKVLISRGLDEPRALVLDPGEGLMFWSDWGDAARIETAWMDGSHRSVIVDTDIGWPNGMAIDVEEKKVSYEMGQTKMLVSSTEGKFFRGYWGLRCFKVVNVNVQFYH